MNGNLRELTNQVRITKKLLAKRHLSNLIGSFTVTLVQILYGHYMCDSTIKLYYYT